MYPQKSAAELREYGFVMAVALVVMGALLLYLDKGKASVCFTAIALIFLVFAIFAPRILGPVEFVWMKFAGVMSVVMTFVILNVTFYLAITPIALMLRLMGKDILSLKFEPQSKSYWTSLEKDGPHTRPFKPY